MQIKIKRALISVSDKKGLEHLIPSLMRHKVQIIASGGTAKSIESFGARVIPIEEITGQKEAFGGRVKTLSFQIAAAILHRRHHDPDLADAYQLGIEGIDLVVCNFYPFAKVRADQTKTAEDIIEAIDIGGPCMVRSAAKNYKGVAVVTSSRQIPRVIDELDANSGVLSLLTRKDLATQAFCYSAGYEQAVSEYFSGTENFPAVEEMIPLRYGENPDQKASLMATGEGIAKAEKLGGKDLSYNNILDANTAWQCVSELARSFNQACTAIIKHANPCGMAVAETLPESFCKAWDGDPVSAFGSVIACSHPVDLKTAKIMNDGRFIEVIIAPDYAPEALTLLTSCRKNLRILKLPLLKKENEDNLHSISGGLLKQSADLSCGELTPASVRKLPDGFADLARFGEICVKHLKSNALALVHRHEDHSFSLTSSGAGQPNRIDCLTRLLIPKALERDIDLTTGLLVSDAFFPFADVIEVCAQHGIQHIVQPGGSIKDGEVVTACDRHNIAMAFNGKRHFRH